MQGLFKNIIFRYVIVFCVALIVFVVFFGYQRKHNQGLIEEYQDRIVELEESERILRETNRELKNNNTRLTENLEQRRERIDQAKRIIDSLGEGLPTITGTIEKIEFYLQQIERAIDIATGEGENLSGSN